MRALEVVGSDLDHHLCPRCGCHDRERHLFLYLTELGLFGDFTGRDVLHFAPERHIVPYIQRANPSRYVRADLYPNDDSMVRADLTAMPFADASFDFVLANHVMEHVADDIQAASEIRRVLKPGGRAILQTPFSAVLRKTIQDPGVVSPAARLALYGQEDHVRLYGLDIVSRFEQGGLISKVAQHEEVLFNSDPDQLGINSREPLLLFQSPSSQ